MKRNGYKKLLQNVRMNTEWLDEKGKWNLPTSPNNQLRMQKKLSTVHGPIRPNAREWVPSKCYLYESDLEDIYDSQGRVCYYFKIPLDFNLLFSNYHGYFPKHPLAPSVDKIDDKGDYTLDNVVISSRFANYGRNVYPFEGMHDLVNLIIEHAKPFDSTNKLVVNSRERISLEEFM